MTLPSPDGASPAIAQWFTLKAAHPDALLLFRMGDFYELFFADAAGRREPRWTSRSPRAGSMRGPRSRCAACRSPQPAPMSRG